MNLLRVAAMTLLLSMPVVKGADANAAIESVMNQQVEAWNRGDVVRFVSFYAEHCTLIGDSVSDETRAAVLAHYQKTYASKDAMGKLTFSNLKVRLVDPKVAIVTASWHLDRNAAGGGPVGGVFSLVMEQASGGGWQIVLDHTTRVNK